MLIVTWHPRYALNVEPKHAGEFALDLQRFARAISGILRPGPHTLNTSPTVADVRRLHRLGLDGVPIATDIETAAQTKEEPWTGKDPQRAKLKTVGIGTEDEAISHKWGDDAAVESVIKLLLEDVRVTKILHNGHYFDCPVLRRHGIDIK